MPEPIIEYRKSQKCEHRDRLIELLASSKGDICVASPYVSDTSFLLNNQWTRARLLTTFTEVDVAVGATSLRAIKSLVTNGVQCRHLATSPRLHAKVYIFDDKSAIISSANFTTRALTSNIEVGTAVGNAETKRLLTWFESLWTEATPLTSATLDALLAETKRINVRKEIETKSRSLKRKISQLVEVPRHDFVNEQGLRELLASFKNVFVCNTNRRDKRRSLDGDFLIEEIMRKRRYAAAWPTTRRYLAMKDARPGDMVLMYAKKLGFPKSGVIGVGRVTGPLEILSPDGEGRLLTDGKGKDLDEWRVPVEWVAWRDSDRLATGNYISLSFHRFLIRFSQEHRDTLLAYFLSSEVDSPLVL